MSQSPVNILRRSTSSIIFLPANTDVKKHSPKKRKDGKGGMEWRDCRYREDARIWCTRPQAHSPPKFKILGPPLPTSFFRFHSQSRLPRMTGHKTTIGKIIVPANARRKDKTKSCMFNDDEIVMGQSNIHFSGSRPTNYIRIPELVSPLQYPRSL
jgi:hypothetical protein